jgi:aminopeptidase N
MNDTVVALQLLVDRGGEDRDAALTAYYERARRVPALVDRWFAVQAMSAAPDCADRIEALTRHPDYGIENATRVKLLFDAFTANEPAFLDISGTGYSVVRKTVMALQAGNPRLAARLLKKFNEWPRFDSVRAAQMRAVLHAVLAQVDMAAELRDLAVRGLEMKEAA